jgi:hypothetical protein
METPYSLFKIMHCISALRMKNIWYYWSIRGKRHNAHAISNNCSVKLKIKMQV